MDLILTPEPEKEQHNEHPIVITETDGSLYPVKVYKHSDGYPEVGGSGLNFISGGGGFDSFLLI